MLNLKTRELNFSRWVFFYLVCKNVFNKKTRKIELAKTQNYQINLVLPNSISNFI